MKEIGVKISEDQFEELQNWKIERGLTWRGVLLAGTPTEKRLVSDGGK